MATKTQYFPAGGGLDVVSSALSIAPGRALTLINHEPWYNGGYRRVLGFERFDGHPKPSDAIFMGFDLVDSTGLTVGDALTGDTTATTGVVVGIDGNSIGVTKVAGAGFDNSEFLNGGSYQIASTPISNASPTVAITEDWLLVAENEYRADIDEVPGSGYVLGAWQRGAIVYAVRDNVGDTEGILHKASASGWVTTGIVMAEYLFFDTGLAAGPILVGNTVTGATSSATGVVHKMVLHGGSWSGNDAYGYLVLTSVTGTFQDTESLEVSAVAVATADGANVAFTFPPDGDYRFFNHNFYGSASTYRTYGCNGVGPAFEIDENNIVSPILFPQTALNDQPANNIPFLIVQHRNYMFMAYPGGSFSHSVIGEPLQLNGFLGAAEFGVGDEITGFTSVVGGVLAVYSQRETRGLYGKDISDWELKLIGEQGGAKLFTVQSIDTAYALDSTGITSLARTSAFGDFVGNTVSELIQPLIKTARELVNDSVVIHESNQYRLYLSNKTVLVMYVPAPGSFDETQGIQNRKGVEFSNLILPIEVRRIFNTEDENGKERTYFVSTDGFVYEDQIGKNYDGESIASAIRLPFNHIGSPAYRKFFRRADLELNAKNAITLKVLTDLGYGTPNIPTNQFDSDVVGSGGFFDTDNFDEFIFDGQIISTARVELTGSAENISFLIFNDTAKAQPWIFQGLVLHYDIRRLQR